MGDAVAAAMACRPPKSSPGDEAARRTKREDDDGPDECRPIDRDVGGDLIGNTEGNKGRTNHEDSDSRAVSHLMMARLSCGDVAADSGASEQTNGRKSEKKTDYRHHKSDQTAGDDGAPIQRVHTKTVWGLSHSGRISGAMQTEGLRDE